MQRCCVLAWRNGLAWSRLIWRTACAGGWMPLSTSGPCGVFWRYWRWHR